MAPTFLFLVVVALTIFLRIASLIVQIYIYRRHKISYRLPPGKTGWPVIGETLNYVFSPEKFVIERMMRHSPDVFRTSIIGEKFAFLCGPLANKFIFSNEGKYVKQWLPGSVVHCLGISQIELDSPSSKLILKHLHKFLQMELQHYVPIMDFKVCEHLETHWLPYNEVKVHTLAKELTFSLACGLFIGCHKPEQIKELAEPFFVLVEGIFSVPVNIPGTPFYRAMKGAKVVRERLANIIRLRLIEGSRAGDIDLLGRLLIAIHESGESVDEEDIISKLVSLLFAGFYTLSNAITFVLDNLAEHPEIYEKVIEEQLEISQSKQKGESLTWNDTQKMKYSWNVVCESLRIRPPAAGGFRQAATDFTYAGFTIPKGWKVFWSVYSTNKDPKYFPNPEKFDPTRFEGNDVAPYAFLPFGAGPRMCIGKEYARIEMLVILFNIATRFRLRKANPDEKIIYTPDAVPVEGLRMHLEQHRNQIQTSERKYR